jgi:hypothetical protein
MFARALVITALSGIALGQDVPNRPVPPPALPAAEDAKPPQANPVNPLNKAVDDGDRFFPNGTVHDFGRHRRGIVCKHTFRIENKSNALLRIVSVRAS